MWEAEDGGRVFFFFFTVHLRLGRYYFCGTAARCSPPRTSWLRPICKVSAAALAVSDIFHYVVGHDDAGWRAVTLSLWDPLATDAERAVGTTLTRLPDQWMLVGLGHLGQAYAWCIGYLPPREREGKIWLCDD